MEWGIEVGAEKVSVTVHFPNKKAIQFYEREGFEPYSTRFERPLLKK